MINSWGLFAHAACIIPLSFIRLHWCTLKHSLMHLTAEMIVGTLDSRRCKTEWCHISNFISPKVVMSVKSNGLMGAKIKTCCDLLYLNLSLKQSQSWLIRMILILEPNAAAMLSNFRFVWQRCSPGGWYRCVPVPVEHSQEKRLNIPQHCPRIRPCSLFSFSKGAQEQIYNVHVKNCHFVSILWQWCFLNEGSRLEAG